MAQRQSVDRFPNLDHLQRNGGSYVIGDTKSIIGVAIASNPQMVYVALMRKAHESLDQLHERLDDAVGQSCEKSSSPSTRYRAADSMWGASEATRVAVSDGGM
jgi:hypothetical protein